MGSSTISGPSADQASALIELTQGGQSPLRLANGETRTFLEDGEVVVFKGWFEKAGLGRIGLGECRGKIA